MIFTYTILSGATGVCVGVLHTQTRSSVLLRVNIITRGWVMIDLKSTAILGSGEKVGCFKHFYLRFQFLHITPETVRRQGSKTAQTILVVRSALYSIAPLALAGQQGFSLRFQAIFANVPAYLKLDPPCRKECRIWDTDFIYKNLSFEQYFSIV